MFNVHYCFFFSDGSVRSSRRSLERPIRSVEDPNESIGDRIREWNRFEWYKQEINFARLKYRMILIFVYKRIFLRIALEKNVPRVSRLRQYMIELFQRLDSILHSRSAIQFTSLALLRVILLVALDRLIRSKMSWL